MPKMKLAAWKEINLPSYNLLWKMVTNDEKFAI